MKRKMCGRPLLSCLLAVLLCIGAAPAQAAETPASEKSGAVNWVETVDEGILQEPVEIPILMYHNLVAEEDDPSISKNTMWVGQFQHQMELLEENGFTTITVDQLVGFGNRGKALPEKPVMITFDDGYYNNYIYAYPLLKQRGMKAVVSIIGSQTALFTDNGEENAYWSHLRLDRLREMQDVFEVQNHSWNLHEYGERRGCLRRRGEDETRYETLLRKDTEQTQTLITDAGLPAPTCYTYPFGACSKESETLLKSMGFRCTLGCEERVNTVTRNPDCLFELGRFNRPAGQSTESFLHRALGED